MFSMHVAFANAFNILAYNTHKSFVVVVFGPALRLNNNNEILIKREPLVYTGARRAVQKKKG